MSSKFYGQEEVLAPFVTKSCLNSYSVKNEFNKDNVRVAKVLGGSLWDSDIVRGMVITREVEGSVTKVENAKIAVFGCPLDP